MRPVYFYQEDLHILSKNKATSLAKPESKAIIECFCYVFYHTSILNYELKSVKS